MQADVHTKLMDRMTTNEELLAYVQSPGRPPVPRVRADPAGGGLAAIGAPVGPIIWSMMAGIVLATVGVGFRLAAQSVTDDAQQAFIVVGVIILALGARLHLRLGHGLSRVVAARPVPAAAARRRSRRPMRDLALTDMERLGAFDEAERTFQMTEEAFRIFYELTARPVRVYLARMTGDDRLADDLLQETYYRFLRANIAFESDDHRRNYLFRIATNLVHDHRRQPFMEVPATAIAEVPDAAARGARPPSAPRAGSICIAPWSSSSRASAACCGSPTRRAGRTKKSPRRSASRPPA